MGRLRRITRLFRTWWSPRPVDPIIKIARATWTLTPPLGTCTKVRWQGQASETDRLGGSPVPWRKTRGVAASLTCQHHVFDADSVSLSFSLNSQKYPIAASKSAHTRHVPMQQCSELRGSVQLLFRPDRIFSRAGQMVRVPMYGKQ